MRNVLSRGFSVGLATFAALFALGMEARAADVGPFPGYAVDASGQLVKTAYGLCVRTGSWTPALAVIECDPDLVKKPEPPKVAQVTPPPPPPAPAPAPAPAPVGPERPAFEVVTLQAETLFDFDKATLRPSGKEKLNDVVAQMKNAPQVEVVLVTGHADRLGTDKYNQRLSERRAAAVKSYLVDQGIAANRIEAQGRGESEPVKQCTGNKKTKALIECLQPNRRVEVEVKVQKPTQSGAARSSTGAPAGGTSGSPGTGNNPGMGGAVR